jgi:transposase
MPDSEWRSAMALKEKYVVRLDLEERCRLRRLARAGRHSARVILHSRILLKADVDGPAWSDGRIAEALDCADHTIARARRRYVQCGLDAAVHRKKPTGRRYRKLDGEQEARLVALACSPAPEGRQRWTMELLADKLVELRVVEGVHPTTVWRTLKKTRSSRG